MISIFCTNKAIGSSANRLQASASLASTSTVSSATSKTPGSFTDNFPIASNFLRKSALATQQLKALHVTVVHTKELSFQASSVKTSSLPLPDNLTLTTNYDGDVQLPDQASFKITIDSKSSSSPSQTVAKVAQIILGMQIYIQDLQDQNQEWVQIGPPYSVTPDTRNNFVFLPVNNDYINMVAILLPFAQDSDITDHGTENAQGTSLHHFTMKLGANALEDFVRLHTADANYSPEAQVLDSAIFDVWTDDSTHYIPKMVLKVNTTEDYSKIKANGDTSDGSTATPRPSASPTPPPFTGIVKSAVTLTVTLSKFNQAVSISAPANATSDNQNPNFPLPSNEQP